MNFLVTDWQKIMVISTAIFIALALFISFLRSTFYDVWTFFSKFFKKIFIFFIGYGYWGDFD